MEDGGLALPAACSYPKSPVCCPLPMGTAVQGWHWAKREGWGREGAQHPAGISPAALSEIAWVNKHESAEGCRGQDGDSTARPHHVKVVGEEIKRQKALGLLITRQTWLDGAVSGSGLSCCHPEPQLSPCPRITVGDGAARFWAALPVGLWAVPNSSTAPLPCALQAEMLP